jgi:(p)ppGpp synthase/HD superfamily hydrolase
MSVTMARCENFAPRPPRQATAAATTLRCMPLLTDQFTRAVDYALRHHADDLRKGTTIPYASHLLSVASLVMDMESGSEDEVIAALLHDVVEDGGGERARAEIRERFGPDVERMVIENSDSLSGEPEKAPWRARKEAYIAALAHKSAGGLRVSVADKLHNARAILTDYRTHGEALWSRFKQGEGDSVVWYYRALVEGFERRADDLGPGGRIALRELDLVVATLEAARDAG